MLTRLTPKWFCGEVSSLVDLPLEPPLTGPEQHYCRNGQHLRHSRVALQLASGWLVHHHLSSAALALLHQLRREDREEKKPDE
jgi:hypothetical protein